MHQYCTTVPALDTLANDFLRTPDLGCNAWEFASDVSTQCEKVMTFAADQNQVSNVGVALENDSQKPKGIIAHTGLPLFHHQRPGPKPERNSAGWQASSYAAREAGN